MWWHQMVTLRTVKTTCVRAPRLGPNMSLRLCVNLQTLQLNGNMNPQPGKFDLYHTCNCYVRMNLLLF